MQYEPKTYHKQFLWTFQNHLYLRHLFHIKIYNFHIYYRHLNFRKNYFLYLMYEHRFDLLVILLLNSVYHSSDSIINQRRILKKYKQLLILLIIRRKIKAYFYKKDINFDVHEHKIEYKNSRLLVLYLELWVIYQKCLFRLCLIYYLILKIRLLMMYCPLCNLWFRILLCNFRYSRIFLLCFYFLVEYWLKILIWNWLWFRLFLRIFSFLDKIEFFYYHQTSVNLLLN